MLPKNQCTLQVVFPQILWLPKIHKPDTPLRPIVSSCGLVTYGVAKELTKMLKPLVGTPDFVEQTRHITLCDTVVLLCHSPRYSGIYQTPTGPG